MADVAHNESRNPIKMAGVCQRDVDGARLRNTHNYIVL